jgi:hypothetical protein
MSEGSEVLRRLETVSYRLRQTLRGKDWTSRNWDADTIDNEVMPAIEKMINHIEKLEECCLSLLDSVDPVNGPHEELKLHGAPQSLIERVRE